MNYLFIDTSNAVMTLAANSGAGFFVDKTEGLSRHSDLLLPHIEALLSRAKLKLSSIDTFFIAAGPGSFTGLRVGLAMLKGLTLGEKKLIFSLTADALTAYYMSRQDELLQEILLSAMKTTPKQIEEITLEYEKPNEKRFKF